MQYGANSKAKRGRHGAARLRAALQDKRVFSSFAAPRRWARPGERVEGRGRTGDFSWSRSPSRGGGHGHSSDDVPSWKDVREADNVF